MFRRWLRLMRDGPGLLGATMLYATPPTVERCDREEQRRENPRSLRSCSDTVPQQLRPPESWQGPSM